jgi:uncharacterized membrane protein
LKTKLFTDGELKNIEQAVEHIENRYAVELVPMFAKQSSDYPEVRYSALLFGFLSGFAILMTLYFVSQLWWFPFPLIALVWVVWTLFILTICETISPLKRLLIGSDDLLDKSLELANHEFVKNEVYSNPERVGILIFVSFFEKKFHFIYDQKGNQYFDNNEWLTLGNTFSLEMKDKKTSEAIIHCIQNLEKLIEKSAIQRTNLPPSFLSNDLIIND